MNRLRLLLASCFYLGLSPFAPGTFGTLGGVTLVLLLRRSPDYLLWLAVVCAVLYVAARRLGSWAEGSAGRKDPAFFVLDEVIGYLITVAWISGPSILALVLGFLFFRFFDIVKPPPARRLERVPGGDGILLDDMVAGVYAFGALTLSRWLFLTPESWAV